MTELPIFPLKVADLLADTYNMDAAEFGAYVRILLTMWQNGGRLREVDLQKISCLSQYSWRRSRAKILRLLTIVDGTVSQKRLEDTRLKVRAKRAKAAASARRRWGTTLPCIGNANVMRMHMRNACDSDAIKISKKEEESSLTDSSESAEPQPVATDEASKTASRDVATESLVRSLQKRGHG